LSEKRGLCGGELAKTGRIRCEFDQKVVEFAMILKAFCHRDTEDTENSPTLLNGRRNLNHSEITDSERECFGGMTIERLKERGGGKGIREKFHKLKGWGRERFHKQKEGDALSKGPSGQGGEDGGYRNTPSRSKDLAVCWISWIKGLMSSAENTRTLWASNKEEMTRRSSS